MLCLDILIFVLRGMFERYVLLFTYGLQFAFLLMAAILAVLLHLLKFGIICEI